MSKMSRRMSWWAAFALCALSVSAGEIRVSPDGISPQAALERIRAAKAAGGQSAWTVRVAPGLYALDRTLVFTPADSGTPEAPVRWVADEGEAIFFGGGLIGGWKILGTDPFECLKTRVLRLPSGWNVVVDAKVRN